VAYGQDAFEVPEHLLIRDLLFSYQGIDGKYLTWNPAAKDFSISSDVRLLFYL
jgi:hypothetical protein